MSAEPGDREEGQKVDVLPEVTVLDWLSHPEACFLTCVLAPAIPRFFFALNAIRRHWSLTRFRFLVSDSLLVPTKNISTVANTPSASPSRKS